MKARCLRCGLGWTPRTARPLRCPNCKSIRWDEPRRHRWHGGLGIQEVIGERRTALVRLGNRHHFHHLRVFGSVARREASDHSDVDILVTPDPGLRGFRAFGALADFNADASRLLRRRVDAHTVGAFPEGSPALREAVTL